MLRGPLVLGVLALALAALAAFGEGFWTLGFGTAAAILLVVALLQQGARRLGLWRKRSEERRLGQLLEHDATPCFTTDAFGQVGFQNQAATARFGASDGGTILAALKDHFAAPSAVLYRLQSRANSQGAAREDVTTQKGQPVFRCIASPRKAICGGWRIFPSVAALGAGPRRSACRC